MTPIAMTPEALEIIARHRRHVELSPGVGSDLQRYALAVLDDVEADLRALAAPQEAPHGERRNVICFRCALDSPLPQTRDTK